MPMFRLAVVFLILLTSTTLAQTNRTELKRADLTGTNMEIIIAVLEVPPGSSVDRHTHPGEEAVYVLEGATLQMPDGNQIARPAGQAGVNVRDVPHAGY
jgi:quercetin dioxygenase-like cupin family protein